jgi:hypothetical protein
VVRKIADRHSIDVVFLSVGIDLMPDQSWRWISETGGADEVSIGQGWTSIGAQSIAMTAGADAPSVPQVQIRWRRIYARGSTIVAWHEPAVAVYSGAVEIRAALKQSTALEALIKATYERSTPSPGEPINAIRK